MKLPIEVHNKLIPFKGFNWVTWLLWSFTRKPMAWSMDETTRRAVRGNPPARRHQLLVRVVGLGAYGGRHSLRRMDLLRHFVADRSDYPALSGRVLLHLLRDRGVQP